MNHPQRVWLLRHAETATPAVFHGAESDVELSSLGHQTAKLCAEWFHERRPDVVYSSGMSRAVQTAAPIAERCNITHRIADKLHERKVGELCGTRFTMHVGPWADTIQRWVVGDTTYTTPGAESYEEIRNRVLSVWNNITSAHANEQIVIVAHGIVCKVLLLSLLKAKGPGEWMNLGRVANLAISELVPDGQYWNAERLLEVPETISRFTLENLVMQESARSRSEA